MYMVKSVGVLSLGKIMGAIYEILGLLFMPIFLVAGIMSSLTGGKGAAFGAAGALVMAILFPILYGLLGFVAGAIGALLYNGCDLVSISLKTQFARSPVRGLLNHHGDLE